MMKRLSCFICITLVMLPVIATAQTYYRFQNSDGVTILEDRLPPEYAKKGYTVLSADGRVIKIVPPALTKTERETFEKKQRQLKQKLQRQEQRDRALLSAYAKAEDIITTRDKKIEEVNRIIASTHASIKHLEEQKTYYKDLIKESPSYLNKKSLQSTDDQINTLFEFIREQQWKKQYIIIKSNSDLLRFRFLERKWEITKNVDHITQLLEGPVIYCKNYEQCEKKWQRAKQFIEQYSPLPIRESSSTVVLNHLPDAKQPIALHLARAQERGEAEAIILLVQCHTNLDEACYSTKAKKLHRNFLKFMR